MSANLLDCTAVAAALFSNHEHVLHLNEHSTFSEAPKLDPAVVPAKYLSQIFRAMVGLGAPQQSQEEGDDNGARKAMPAAAANSKNESLMREPGTMASARWDQVNDDDGAPFGDDAEKQRKRKPGASAGGNRYPHPNAPRNSRTNSSVVSPSAAKRATSGGASARAPPLRNAARAGSAASTAAEQPTARKASAAGAAAVAGADASISPFESRLSRKAAVVANVVRTFMTHRLYRRQSMEGSSASSANNNTIWISGGFANMRYAAPVVCGVVGRLLHLAAAKEAETAAICVARCMELLDAVVVSTDLLQPHPHASSSASPPPHVFPVPLFDVTISHAEAEPLDDLSVTYTVDRLHKHVSGAGAPKRYCKVEVSVPAPPFAPPVFALDLARALVLAGPDALRSYMPSGACCQWIAAVPVPRLQQQQPTQQLSGLQEHAEMLSPYKQSTPTVNADATSTTRPSSLWHSYLEAISFIAGDCRAEDVAEFVRAVAALIIATEIRLVPHTINNSNSSSSSSAAASRHAAGAAADPASAAAAQQRERFTRAANKCGLLPATLRDAQGLQHLADLLQQPSAEALLATLQAVPTGGRTSAVPYHLQQQHLSVDAGLAHHSARTAAAAAGQPTTPLLKIAFVPDTIYRSVVQWLLAAVNTRLMRLSCAGAGVPRGSASRVLVALCETRNAAAMFGAPAPLPHSVLPMHLVGDAAADCWRRVHCVLERRHAAWKRREHRRALSMALQRGEDDGDFVDADDGYDDVQASAGAIFSELEHFSPRFVGAAQQQSQLQQQSEGPGAGVVGSAEWQRPILLPLVLMSQQQQQAHDADGDHHSPSSASPRSTAQLVQRWPLAGLLLHGIAPSVAALRKMRLGGAISHLPSAAPLFASSSSSSAAAATAAVSSGTIQLQHAHGPVAYTSMTTGATPCFIIADDQSSRRFSATATLYGSAAAADGGAGTSVAAQRWRQGEQRAALEALDRYFSAMHGSLRAAYASQMDQDFLFLSLGYSHLDKKKNGGNNDNSATAVGYSLLDEHGAEGLDRGTMFVDSTAAQACAMRFRMDTEVRAPNVPRFVFPQRGAAATGASSSRGGGALAMNLGSSLMPPVADGAQQQPPPSTSRFASSSVLSTDSVVTSAMSNRAATASSSAASSTARAYGARHMPDPLAAAKRTLPLVRQQQHPPQQRPIFDEDDDGDDDADGRRQKSLSVVSCSQQQQQQQQENERDSLAAISAAADNAVAAAAAYRQQKQRDEMAEQQESLVADDEPDPAPPTPNARPLLVSASAPSSAPSLRQQHRDGSWLRFGFTDFCRAFFDGVAHSLKRVEGLQTATDAVFVAAVCTARGLRPGADFILLPDEGQILVSKRAVVSMASADSKSATAASAAAIAVTPKKQTGLATSTTTTTAVNAKISLTSIAAEQPPTVVRMTKTGAYNNNSRQQQQQQQQRCRSPVASTSNAALQPSSARSLSSLQTNSTKRPLQAPPPFFGGRSVSTVSTASSMSRSSSVNSAAAAAPTPAPATLAGRELVSKYSRQVQQQTPSLSQQDFGVDSFKAMRDAVLRRTAAPQLQHGDADAGDQDVVRGAHSNSKSPARIVAVSDGPRSLSVEVDHLLLQSERNEQQQQQQRRQFVDSFVSVGVDDEEPPARSSSAFVHHPIEDRLRGNHSAAGGGSSGALPPSTLDFSAVGARDAHDLDVMEHDVPTVDFASVKRLLAATASAATGGGASRRSLLHQHQHQHQPQVQQHKVVSPRRTQLEDEVASLLSSLAPAAQPIDDGPYGQEEEGHECRRSVDSVTLGSPPQMQQQQQQRDNARSATRLLNLSLNTTRQSNIVKPADNNNGHDDGLTLQLPPQLRQARQQQRQHHHDASAVSGAPSSLASFLGGAPQNTQAAGADNNNSRHFYSL